MAAKTTSVDILFKALSDATGGIITDMTSLMVMLVCISALAMGFDFLMFLLECHIKSTKKAKKLKLAVDQQKLDYQRFSELHEKLKKQGSAERAWEEAEYSSLKGKAGSLDFTEEQK